MLVNIIMIVVGKNGDNLCASYMLFVHCLNISV